VFLNRYCQLYHHKEIILSMMSLAIKEMHDAQENVRQQQLTGGDGA
jgi:hypothetical protein